MNARRYFFFLTLLVFALAGAAQLFTRPAAALPPRPPAPTPLPASTPAAPPEGGTIILTAEAASPVPPELWTEVEWQDSAGEWRKVDGWRGSFNEALEVVWWVGPEHLGQGPFRWLVYAAEGSEKIVAVSESFYLPAESGEETAVTVTLP